MPTIIQTHLITEKTWQETTNKAKELEHIIRKCDPPAAALPTLAKGTTVPGLYSQIAHSDDRVNISPNLSKGPGLSNLSREAEERANSLHKNQKIRQYRHRTIHTIMTILIIIILRIIEANLEDVDPIEAKIQVVSLEAKISVTEVNEIRTRTKANIKTMAIKATITKATEVYIRTNTEISNRVIITAKLEAEAMAETEAIIVAMVTAGPFIKVILITNTISIMAMMMTSTRQINMVHHVPYVVDTITLLNIVSRESMISMILWKRFISGHQSQSSGLYS